MDFCPESYGLCSLKVKGEFFNVTVMCVHASAEERDEEQKDAFYDHSERLCFKALKHDMKTVMGDFNMKVGSKQGYAPNIKKCSLCEETNGDGWTMVGFVVARSMVVIAHCSSKKCSSTNMEITR
jgi:endonuclease/exonuclease/phosphatase family metal-dependent hydrolase